MVTPRRRNRPAYATASVQLELLAAVAKIDSAYTIPGRRPEAAAIVSTPGGSVVLWFPRGVMARILFADWRRRRRGVVAA